MKIQIENLRVQMRGVQLNSYQRALALDEYYKLLDYVEELEQLTIPTVSVSVLPDEEMREPIENALYATRRFLTTQATDLAEGIIQYIKDAGYIIVRTER